MLERQTLLDYSHPLGEAAYHWVSKPPGKLSPATNILRIFDIQSWIIIGVSILSVIAAFIIISKVGRCYGVETPMDNFHIAIYPLSTLTAENMSRSFERKSKKSNKSFFSPGFAGNSLLLVWTITVAFISMAFLSMIRATLMIPLHGDPIDTAEDIFRQGKIPMILKGMWAKYLKTSTDVWVQRTGKLEIQEHYY